MAHTVVILPLEKVFEFELEVLKEGLVEGSRIVQHFSNDGHFFPQPVKVTGDIIMGEPAESVFEDTGSEVESEIFKRIKGLVFDGISGHLRRQPSPAEGVQ